MTSYEWLPDLRHPPCPPRALCSPELLLSKHEVGIRGMVRDGALLPWERTFDVNSLRTGDAQCKEARGSPHLDAVFVELVSPVQRCSEWGGWASAALWKPSQSQAAAAWSGTLDTVSACTVSTRGLRLEVRMVDWGHHV